MDALSRASHFARILPITGEALFSKRVAVTGFPAADAIVPYLAANGVGKWLWLHEDDAALRQLHERLAAQHGDALELHVETSATRSSNVDLIIAIGEGYFREGRQLAASLNAPLLAAPAGDGWEWNCRTPLVALNARRLLLGEQPFPLPNEAVGAFRAPPVRRGNVLIAGLGSLGSVAATHLAPYVKRMVLADRDVVDDFNPVRQAYPIRTIGQKKADALANLLAAQQAETVSVPGALTDEQQVMEIVRRYDISAALVVTGTQGDFAIARGLRAAGVPHVVGRCYPRARYWEGIVVDGELPSFQEMRGHVAMGPSAAPTPEQRLAYSNAGALEGEPATLIESGWAAAWLARLLRQLILPPGLRGRWFLQRVAARETCFIGGLRVEQTARGPAYGIEQVGQVRAYARAAVRGTAPATESPAPSRCHH